MGSRNCRQLLVDQVPVTFQELFIRSGYREPNISGTQCIRSCFQLTNETLNVWTHLLPGFYFVWLLGNQSRDMDYIRDPYTWPMLCFMLALILFTFASVLAHVFNALSDTARHTCFFVDYWAINMYAIGGAIAYRAYLLPRAMIGSKFASVFLYISFFNAVIPMCIMCNSRFLQYSKLKTLLRMIALALPYFFTNLTLLYRMLLWEEEDRNNSAFWLYFRQFCMAFLSALFYTSHIPERFIPGVFDIFGHSHQIFHICAVIGSRDQMRGMLLDMTKRKEYLTANDTQVTFCSSLGLFILVGLINLAILFYFRGKLKSKISRSK